MAEVRVPTLSEIADAEADKALREIHDAEWKLLRKRLYTAMKSAIRWHKTGAGEFTEDEGK